MNYKFMLLSLVFLIQAPFIISSNLSVEDAILYVEDQEVFVVCELRWENSWKDNRNHDASWLFFKWLQESEGYRHLSIASEGHSVESNLTTTNPNLRFETSPDKTGIFIYPTETAFYDYIHCKVKIRLDDRSRELVANRQGQFHAYGIEMVYIPEGAFTLGDPDPASHSFGSMFRSAGSGRPGGLFRITGESQRVNISEAAGDLYYLSGRQRYEGDQRGSLPASFPKGFQAFYIMKYEPTQGQYASFLNSLSNRQVFQRSMIGGRDYYQHRGTIFLDNGHFEAKEPERPCNFMSWDDGVAFADWAGLRPMTEFEFTKAARGTGDAIPKEFPWGSNSKSRVLRVIDAEGNLSWKQGYHEGMLSRQNVEEELGASYYWVMDLAGSMWERVITIGDQIGRSFAGTHGDGLISYYGFATNEDWPKGIDESGGFGYRGGGYYEPGHRYSEFNPYSPIAYRRFGAWSGGERFYAYGARFVRTAP